MRALTPIEQDELRVKIGYLCWKEAKQMSPKHGNGNGGGGVTPSGTNRFISNDDPVDLVAGMRTGTWTWRS